MNENVRKWMYNSWKAWKSGLLQDISAAFKESASGEFGHFSIGYYARYVLMRYSFFRETVPMPDEYLIFNYEGTGKLVGKLSAILTNRRLWMLEKGTGQFICIMLDDIKELKYKGGLTAVWLRIIFKDGTQKEYKDMVVYPPEKVVRAALNNINNPGKSEKDRSEQLENESLLNVPFVNEVCSCSVCSKNDMGNAPHKLTWIIVKKTGETLKHHALFTGTMGGYADIWGYRVNPVGKIITSVCTDCQNTFGTKAVDETKRLQEERYTGEIKSRRTARVAAIIAFIIFFLDFLYMQFISHWSMSLFAFGLLIVSPVIAVGSFIYSITKPGPLAPLDDPTEAGVIVDSIVKAHDDQLQKLVTQSPEYSNAVILQEDKCPPLSDSDKDVFVMSLSRYEIDEYQGYALFNMEKTQHEPGGSRKIEASCKDLKEFTENVRTGKDHTMNLGEYIVKNAE